MSKLKIGINGFGRIGRMVMRASLERDDVQIVAINDLLDINHLAYLLKYDSVHGKCNADISVVNNNLSVNGDTVIVSAGRANSSPVIAPSNRKTASPRIGLARIFSFVRPYFSVIRANHWLIFGNTAIL